MPGYTVHQKYNIENRRSEYNITFKEQLQQCEIDQDRWCNNETLIETELQSASFWSVFYRSKADKCRIGIVDA